MIEMVEIFASRETFYSHFVSIDIELYKTKVLVEVRIPCFVRIKSSLFETLMYM